MCRNTSCMDRKDLIKTLEGDGWFAVHQKGSHLQFKHEVKKGKITVPYSITKNIQLSVLKQAGLR